MKLNKWLILFILIIMILSISFNVLALYNRFNVVKIGKYEGISGWTDSELYIAKDKNTGVCYLIFEGYEKGGITVMYDSNGKILIDK